MATRSNFLKRRPSRFKRFKPARVLSVLALRERHWLPAEPSARYQSVAQFEADLENYRLARPALARRQTVLYRSGRFASRHKPSIALTAVVVACLLAAGAYACRAQLTALEEARRTKVMKTFLMRLFQSINAAYAYRISSRFIISRNARSRRVVLL